MIGKELFYAEGGEIKSSPITAIFIRESPNKQEVMLTTASNITIPQKEACLTLHELLVKLQRDYYEKKKGAKNGN